MKIELNPYFIFDSLFSSGMSTIDGSDITFSQPHKKRLLQLNTSPQIFIPQDITLLETGAAIFTKHRRRLHENILLNVADNIKNSASLIIMPTEKCNFRCTYCYETFEKGKMSESVISGLKIYMTKTITQFKNYNLAWFGGEPLLHKDIIADLSHHFTETRKKAGVDGSISVTTNGYLLNSDAVLKLSDAGLDVYHITLDGPKEIHDSQRIPINGKPTYDKIFENIRMILEESTARVVLRVNIAIENKSVLSVIEKWLTKEVMPTLTKFDDRIDYYIVPIWDATTTSIEGICLSKLLDFQRFARLKDATLRVKGQSLRQDLSSMVKKSGSLSCYAGTPNSYVIGADGAVYKCSVAVDLSENRVGSLTEDGSLNLDSDKEAVWTHQNALTDPTCNSCHFAKSCQGIFCPLVRLQTNKPPCPTEKKFAQDILDVNY
jgi:uncharacterized protein